MEEREMELRLAVVQQETLTGADAPKNVDRAVAYIRQAARDGAKLVMLPETYPGPYTVPVNYSPHEALAAVAGEEKVYVVGGAVEYIRPDDVGHAPCYNCLYLYGPNGQRIGKYRRTTPPGPWIYEGGKFWDFKYQEADELPVWDTEFGKLGILMCSEVYVPELSRMMALQGARITLLPAGLWPPQLHETWRTLIWARAIENLMITATSRNILEGGSGHAMICSPEEILLESRKPGVFTVTVDLARLEWLRNELDRRVDGTLPWRTKPGIFKQWIRPELYRGYERL
jgi:predicted amidohydrolase